MEGNGIADAVVYAGIIMGGLIILSVVWVWTSKQQFGVGGGMLTFFGTVLIGLSVVSKAEFSIGGASGSVEFDRLQKQVKILQEEKEVIAGTVNLVAGEVNRLSKNAEIQRAQFRVLGESIAAINTEFSPAVSRAMLPLRNMKPADPETKKKLEDAKTLQQVKDPRQ